MERQDIVLLTVDSLRHDVIFDDELSTSKLRGITKLVENGTALSNAWSTGPYTRTSMPGIFSGCFPWSFDGEFYESDRPHVAERFAEAGYQTAGFHSNPFLDERYGWSRGFDTYFTGSFTEGGSPIKRWAHALLSRSDRIKGWGRQFLSLVGRRTGRDLRGGGKPYVPASVIHDQVTDWLKDSSGPRFLWIHYMDVHNPWYPHEETVSAGIDNRRLQQIFFKARDSPSSIHPDERALLERAYRGSIQHFDRKLDEFLTCLDQELNDPIVCLTADHGELFGEAETYFHPGVLERELLHVPLVFSGFETTVNDDTPVSLVDIVPTLLEAGDIAPSSNDFDGIDLCSDENDRQEVFASARDSVRIISQERNSVYNIDKTEHLPFVSEVGRKHLSRLRRGGLEESVDQFSGDDLDDQLEALGYK